MKKVLVAGAALMLAGGIASTASAAAVEPGVKITGDARVRFYYADDQFRSYGLNSIGTATTASQKSQTNFDQRVRVMIKGTAAGGAYAVTRLRIAESNAGDVEYGDYSNAPTWRNSNIVADMAYIGIPFTDNFTLELGRYRSTYGPLPASYNWFYDDVNGTGARAIIKFADVEINPFIEWMNEGQNSSDTGYSAWDSKQDNDTIRFGAHVKAKINKDWTVGGMAGYQVDNREQRNPSIGGTDIGFEKNDGFFGSVYVAGKAGNFGIAGELSVTGSRLNNWNAWEYDYSGKAGTTNAAGVFTPAGVDCIGSADTGWGGFILPNYQIDKLNLAVLLGFTQGGFQPDGAFGDGVLLGTIDNSVISAVRIGDYGDWLFGGLVATYQFNESLKLTGNLLYASVDAWETVGPGGDGPATNFRSVSKSILGKAAGMNDAYVNPVQLDNAWTISALLQYTISKGMDVYFSAGYLKPSFDKAFTINGVHYDLTGTGLNDDGIFAAATRFELKF